MRGGQRLVALAHPSLHDAGNYKQSEAEFREGSWRGRLPGAWLRKRATISLWSRACPSASAASSRSRTCRSKCRAARILSIIGPNGAGKTSLLNMISGFYKPDTGRITLEGRDITQQAPERDRRARRRPHLPEHRAVQRPDRARQPDARPPRAHARGRARAASSTGAWRRREEIAPSRGVRGDHRVPEAAGPAQAADRRRWPTACASASSSAARWRSSPRCCCSTSRWAA